MDFAQNHRKVPELHPALTTECLYTNLRIGRKRSSYGQVASKRKMKSQRLSRWRCLMLQRTRCE
uniref:Family with sequence similarity 162 member A n=2 Tax=Homininae TaxID=207598 RepID=A0A2R9A7X6_PANPA|nr:putative FWP002 [Homo sapiens]